MNETESTPYEPDKRTLQAVNSELETRVAERTRRLQEAHDRLAEQNEELSRAYQEIQRAEQYKDEFLSVISHELRTPLNYITGFGSLLQDEVAGPMNAMQTEYLGKMLEGADRMLALVNDLLDVAKIQAGHLDIAPRTIPYGDLLDEVLDTMRPFAEKKAIQLTVRVDAPVTAEIDGPRVEQVLTNLLSNAIKFTPDHGSVTIRAYEHDRELVTQVIDTGRGIAAKDIPYLFTRFKQLDMSMTREAGGVGLGLAICKAIVEGHRGTIGVLSHPGEGSTFWFSLPLTAATEGLRLPPKPEILP